MTKEYSRIQDRLLIWFAENQRDLPWRRSYTPYEIWIAEIMLQQTQVKTVVPYYCRWVKRFPDVHSIAAASEEEMLKVWEGLGYYSRLRNIHKTAKILVSEFAGRFPREHRTILSLPGIGVYTAGAIMSLAFDEDRPVVDGNVERLFARLFNIRVPVKTKEGRESIWRMAKGLIPKGKARYFNQAMMEMGALVCLPRHPTCPVCPLKDNCQSLRSGVVDQRPVPGKRKAVTPIEAAVGVLVDRGKILIQKRSGTGLMPHLWEFPGGKLKGDGEKPEEALVREFREELELDIRCLDKIAVIKHSYTSFRVVLHAFYCALENIDQKHVPHAADEARWVTREQLNDFPFPAASRKLIGLFEEDLRCLE